MQSNINTSNCFILNYDSNINALNFEIKSDKKIELINKGYKQSLEQFNKIIENIFNNQIINNIYNNKKKNNNKYHDII